MHLLHIKAETLEDYTGDPDQLEFKTFLGDEIPEYAILSHTWGDADDEVSFAELKVAMKTSRSELDSDVTKKAGYTKIRQTCWQALEAGYSYAWIDTCCIDKDSSSELSRAINSMFNWYERSAICYAYLADVDSADVTDHEVDAFTKSRWFTRGWTLQELLGPREVLFFDAGWKLLGTRNERFLQAISERTGIQKRVLQKPYLLYEQSVASRMSWAAGRKTTQQEDAAYCLLGIFGVNLPLLYGEGKHAFERLQREVFRKTNDQSIFVWEAKDRHILDSYLLAPSAECFAAFKGATPCNSMGLGEACELVNGGLRVTTRLVKSSHTIRSRRLLAILKCEFQGQIVALPMSFVGQRRQGVFQVDSDTMGFRRCALLNSHSALSGSKKDIFISEKSERIAAFIEPLNVYVRFSKTDNSWGALTAEKAWPEDFWDLSECQLLSSKPGHHKRDFFAKRFSCFFSLSRDKRWSGLVLKDQTSQKVIVIRFRVEPVGGEITLKHAGKRVEIDIQSGLKPALSEMPPSNTTPYKHRPPTLYNYRVKSSSWSHEDAVHLHRVSMKRVSLDDDRELKITVDDRKCPPSMFTILVRGVYKSRLPLLRKRLGQNKTAAITTS